MTKQVHSEESERMHGRHHAHKLYSYSYEPSVYIIVCTDSVCLLHIHTSNSDTVCAANNIISQSNTLTAAAAAAAAANAIQV